MFGAIFSLSLLLALAAGAVIGWMISSFTPDKHGELQEEQKRDTSDLINESVGANRSTPLNDGEDFVD